MLLHYFSALSCLGGLPCIHAFPSIIRFFGSGLFRHDQVSAGYAENSLLLHGRYDMCLEPFRRQRNLYDMCALPSGCFQQIQIIIDENSAIRRLRQCRCMLKIPPIRIDKGKPCRLFGMLMHKGKEVFQELEVFLSRQAGYAFRIVVIGFLGIVGWINRDSTFSPIK